MDAVVELEPQTVFSLAGLVYLLLALGAGMHVVLNKQNEGAAFSWLGVIVLSPLLGALLYWLFGINRIRRRARAGRPDGAYRLPPHRDAELDVDRLLPDALLDEFEPRWRQLMRLGAAIHPEAYTSGNALELLHNGDEAYPRMLAAIDGARETVRLSSYIFSNDVIGQRFVEALARASERGVQVRVLIDGVGISYGLGWIRVDRALRRRGVNTVRFLSTFSTSGTRFLNLRNHRKILLVDGTLAFVGGLNIRDHNLLALGGRHATRDVHFAVRGPVLAQIDRTFRDDWRFAAKERLTAAPVPAPVPAEEGCVDARVLLDGPDEDYAKLQMTMVAVINAARQRIEIVTPYFLPDRSVLNALQLAALRGVRIDVVVPADNNLPFVGWAMQANAWKLLDYGIRLHESPSPFDHSKLFLVDDLWCLIGSSNWDARSLELNFEINLECYDVAFNACVSRLIAARKRGARRVMGDVRPSLPIRLRNNFFRLFSPYL